MCFHEFMEAVRKRGITATEGQVRWAIRAGHISRPRLDGSLRFHFDERHVDEIATLARAKADATV